MAEEAQQESGSDAQDAGACDNGQISDAGFGGGLKVQILASAG